MAIEIIPKKKEEKVSSVGSVGRYVGMEILFLAIVASVIFLILTWRTTQEVADIRADIEAKKSPEVLLLENELRDYRRRVLDFAYILEARKSPDPMLEVIERSIHPDVYLSSLQIDVNEKSIKTNGIAADITAFDQQVKLFNKEAMIVSSGIESFDRMDDGSISFPMNIIFSDGLFNSGN